MTKIYSISWTADHEQYFPGHSNLRGEHETGVGETLGEAFEDALDSLAQRDIEIPPEAEKELCADLQSSLRKPYNLETDIREIECDHASLEEDQDCAVCAGNWHFYVTIDIN